MSYTLKLSNESIEDEDEWGAFVVYKDFKVTHPVHKSKDIYGYVIQKISRKTKAFKLDNGHVELINNIEDFTDGFVKYMNIEYYEIFYIAGGESVDADHFQNGAILRYYPDGVADDEPPTAGYIEMSGINIFIPDTKENVLKAKKSKKLLVNILGLEWSTSQNTPANGLPYRESMPVDFQNRSESNIVKHFVLAYWNGIPNYKLHLPINENTKNINKGRGNTRKRSHNNNQNNSLIFNMSSKNRQTKRRNITNILNFNKRNNITKTHVKTSITNTQINYF